MFRKGNGVATIMEKQNCSDFLYITLGLAAVRSKKIPQLYWGNWKYSNIIMLDGVLWKAMRTGVYVDYIMSYFIP